MILRSLLPSWKFFEDIGDNAILFFKLQDSDGSWSEWQEFHRPMHRKFWHLFFFPRGNLQLAEKSALQHAVRDLLEEDRQNPLSLQIVRNIVTASLPLGRSHQFKISIYDENRWEDIFVSEVSDESR